MPPRRAKKSVALKAKADSDSDHEAPSESLTSKLASKLKSIVGLESEGTESADATKKRKRASSIGENRDEDEPPAPALRTKVSQRKSTAEHRAAQRDLTQARNAAKDHDEDEEVASTPNQEPARSRRTKASRRMTAAELRRFKLANRSLKRTRRSAVAAAATKDDSSSSESEDELATAPVSPVKPRPKGGAKSATTTPRKSASASGSGRKSVSNSTRKTRKTQDEYDSSVRELSHSSDSPTPSETSEFRGSADYDPTIDEVMNKPDSTEEEEEAALETMEVDSDALDDESDFGPHKIAERASASPVKKRTPNPEKGRKSTGSGGRKSVGKRAKKEASSEQEHESDHSGPVVVGKIVKAPETGRVPPGQISQNTFDFLLNLQDPAKNDREWFKLHDPVFRLAEKEWVAFVDAWVTTLVEVDDQVPPLPPKDVIHRIYRDVRFSNDKTPYKPNFSASTSRSGRKGIFAGYHISIKPGGGSMVAAGTWCPGKNEIQSIRNVIKRNHGRRLRQVLAEPSFVKYFGPPKPRATKGKERKRQSIFGAEDELKVAPAGVKKDHPDIDLLKCRSFAVVHRFTDAQVLRPDFLEKTVKPVLIAMRPFVHCLNDYMTLSLGDISEGSGSSSDEE